MIYLHARARASTRVCVAFAPRVSYLARRYFSDEASLYKRAH